MTEYTNPKDKLLDALDKAQTNPLIKIDWDMWCEPHLHFLKAQWPKGSAIAMLALFQTAAENKEIADYCKGETIKLNEALRHFSPVCCHLGSEVMDELTKKVKKEAGI